VVGNYGPQLICSLLRFCNISCIRDYSVTLNTLTPPHKNQIPLSYQAPSTLTPSKEKDHAKHFKECKELTDVNSKFCRIKADGQGRERCRTIERPLQYNFCLMWSVGYIRDTVTINKRVPAIFKPLHQICSFVCLRTSKV